MSFLGFIGLGTMGLPLASNLISKSGLAVVGFDVSAKRTALFENQGGLISKSLHETASKCNILFLCLPSNEIVKETAEELITSARAGTIIIDLSSTSPTIIRSLYERARIKHIEFLDSPLSGGETGAKQATVVMMCGGKKEVFEKVKPLLLCMGRTATYMGDAGSGSIAKLANNMIVGANLLSVAESMAFAVKAGLNPKLLFEAIKDGYAGSVVLSQKAQKLLERDFTPGARLAVHRKDIKNAMEEADELGINLPLCSLTLEYMDQAIALGSEDEDHCAIAKAVEHNIGVEIR